MLLTNHLNYNLGYQVKTYTPDIVYLQRYKEYPLLHTAYNFSDNKYNTTLQEYKNVVEDGVQYGGSYMNPVGSGYSNMSGAGNPIMGALKMLKTGKDIYNTYTGETGNRIRNTIGNVMKKKNPNWRPGFAGEKHGINEYGLTYNFLGWC